MRLRDGRWAIGCAFLVDPEAILQNRERIERLFAARKSPLRMVKLIGVSSVLRFLAGRLTVEHIERKCARILGFRGVAVRTCPPELAYDIDNPEEYRYALRCFDQTSTT